MLTFVCWKWRQPQSSRWMRSYTSRHVNALYRQLKENLTIPFRLICVTDDVYGIRDEVLTMPLWDQPQNVKQDSQALPNCYKRLYMFTDHAKRMFGKEFVSIDLDVLILGNIDNLFDHEHSFKILKGKSSPYNGSMWQLKTGTHNYVWDEFNPETSPAETKAHGYFGSDQAWMSHKIKNAPTWGEKDGIYQFVHIKRNNGVIPDDARIIFFAGSVKPWSIAMRIHHKLFNIWRHYDSEGKNENDRINLDFKK